jgi:glutathione synthase/RimK-type ligase-like ATP-grasp enzyme
LKLAVLTPAPEYRADWRWAYDVEAEALERAGLAVTPLPWTTGDDLLGFDLVLPLVAWGYHEQYDRWLRFLAAVDERRVPVANGTGTLRWNSDKVYLAELGEAGVSTVPTLAVDSLCEGSLDDARAHFSVTDLVVKPPISASAYGTHRLRQGDPFPEPVRGWRMLVQPWIEAITDSGEYSLIFFDGKFSHAVSKVPKSGEFRVQPEYGGLIVRCDPPAGSLELASSALQRAPEPVTYARVDIVVGNTGELQIIELELIEPALFLDHAPEAGAAFAAAVRSAAERARK